MKSGNGDSLKHCVLVIATQPPPSRPHSEQMKQGWPSEAREEREHFLRTAGEKLSWVLMETYGTHYPKSR